MTGTGAAAHLERRQYQLAELEYVQEYLIVLPPATANVTVTVIVTVSVPVAVSVSASILAEAATVTVIVLVAETLMTVSLGEAHVKPAEQTLLGMLPVHSVATQPVAVWRLSVLAGIELGTSWGCSSKEALVGVGGEGECAIVVKGFGVKR